MNYEQETISTHWPFAQGVPTQDDPLWNPDMFLAILFYLNGPPTEGAQEGYILDALSFAQANDVATLIGTPEGQAALYWNSF